MNKLMIFAACLAVGLINTPPTVAEGGDITHTVEFRYDAEAPADEIYRDLRRAAYQACRVEKSVSLHFAQVKAERKCRSEFVERAVDMIGKPSLYSYYQNRTGRTSGRFDIAQSHD